MTDAALRGRVRRRARQGRSARGPARRARLGGGRVQRRRRQRLPGRVGRAGARAAGAGGHRRQPQLSRQPSPAGADRWRATSICAHEFVATARADARRLSRQRRRPLLPLQDRALRHAVGAGARRAASPPWSTAPTPTIAATTGPAARRRASYGVRSPLDELGFAKDDIRALARALGMPMWDEPASACLSSRIPHHTEVTRRQAASRSSGPKTRCAPWASACSACATTTPGAARGRRATNWRGRWSRRWPSRLIGRAARRRLPATSSLDPRGYRQGSLNEPLFLRPVP